MVIRRPLWIWDSRAPFHNFIFEHKRINRQFGSIVVSTEAASYYLRHPIGTERRVRQILHIDKGSGRAGRAWMMFKRGSTHPDEHRNANQSPELFLNAIAEAEVFIQQAALVAYAAMFETYVLCWSLNYLLAHLESGLVLDPKATLLAETFAGKPNHLKAPDAFRAFPSIRAGLASIPHVFVDPKTDKPAEEPLDSELNALSVVTFWRAYRNNVVHGNSLVTESFAQRYGKLWERLRSPYGRSLVAMRTGERLQFNDNVIRATFTVHYRAAYWMIEQLVNLSNGRRGHVLAPNAPDVNAVVGPFFTPERLLLPGDHQPSVIAAAAHGA